VKNSRAIIIYQSFLRTRSFLFTLSLILAYGLCDYDFVFIYLPHTQTHTPPYIHSHMLWWRAVYILIRRRSDEKNRVCAAIWLWLFLLLLKL
jgi:hypothetical protein